MLLLDQVQSAVNDALSNRLLAAFHDHVHEFGQLYIAELGIRQDFTFGDFATTWHFYLYLCFSWHLFRYRESYSKLSLTRPAQNIRAQGHYV